MMIDVNNNIFLMDSSFIFSEIASFFWITWKDLVPISKG
jgi:hypothetical protein